MEDYLKVVVAGEVDAGKSTLIGRLLFEMGSLSKEITEQIKHSYTVSGSSFEFAYVLDSLEEERKGNLTIDTTQVFCKNRKGKGFVFIDVPGHRELLRNALCGSSYADAAILVIDIKKPISDGTKRHIDILKFLGIGKVISVLNKIDSADFSETAFNKAKMEIADFFNALDLSYENIIPVSATEGDNLVKRSKRVSWYQGQILIQALNKLNKESPKEKVQDFYFPIQDIYRIDGESFFIGPILSGSVKKGQVVKIAPSAKTAKIKAIRVFNHTISYARQAQSVGLELDEKSDINRGQVIYSSLPPEIVTQVNAKIYCVRRLNTADTFIFKCLTQETKARIQEISKVINTSGMQPDVKADVLETGAVAEAVIVIQNPVAVKKYIELNSLGRFVLENNREICAVGIIN
jgi:bifunctional enzyme CysN/CysC/sulfate adenylyltransferase subunit 1